MMILLYAVICRTVTGTSLTLKIPLNDNLNCIKNSQNFSHYSFSNEVLYSHPRKKVTKMKICVSVAAFHAVDIIFDKNVKMPAISTNFIVFKF